MNNKLMIVKIQQEGNLNLGDEVSTKEHGLMVVKRIVPSTNSIHCESLESKFTGVMIFDNLDL